ncbi:glycoside hydrolase family 6 protein [Protofrankia coriariae]|uniref:glycoside hydrolase family 6 protein n=1 Tax=Protofrankia coriariae TaxID=1562887 RepID=UPI001F462861|nr:glycoside hydrolase family 6 protein [Protofrankia coriariae]
MWLVPVVVAAVFAGFGCVRVVFPEASPASSSVDVVIPRPVGTVAAGPLTAVASLLGSLAPAPAQTPAAPVAQPTHPAGHTEAPAARPLPAQSPAAPATASGNPFAGSRFYVDPDSEAVAAVARLRNSAPADAAALSRIANTSHADWFGGDTANPDAVRTRVAGRVNEIRAAGALPVLVAYAIPNRDCGSYSAGGAGSPDSYRAWIAAFAAGIGRGPAAVILEPDAIAQTDCLSAADRQTRYSLLSNAVDVLARAGVAVYLDAGNATWHSAADTAARLRAAGVDRARGFALNVSNFDETADERAYAAAVSAALGGTAHAVIDTSRNGLGPAPGNVWCNPPGRALGAAPTSNVGDPIVDAYLWIKVPGESDGTCNGGPGAGQWWLDYALGLAARAAG